MGSRAGSIRELRASDGSVYFYDKDTGQTSWSDPSLQHELWNVFVDDDTGDEYWVNKKTQEATWEEPTEVRELRLGSLALPDFVAPLFISDSDPGEAPPFADETYENRRRRLIAMKDACVAQEDYDGAIAAKLQLDQLDEEFGTRSNSSHGIAMRNSVKGDEERAAAKLGKEEVLDAVSGPTDTFSPRPSYSGKSSISSASLEPPDGKPEDDSTRNNFRSVPMSVAGVEVRAGGSLKSASSAEKKHKRRSVRMAFASLRPRRRQVIRDRPNDHNDGFNTVNLPNHDRNRSSLSHFLQQQKSSPELMGAPATRAPNLGDLWDSVERRTTSFSTYEWPLEVPSGASMAQAGFVMLPPKRSRADRAQCFKCGLTLSLWEEGDDPLVEHRRFRPNCAALGQTGDVTIQSHSDASVNPKIAHVRQNSISSTDTGSEISVISAPDRAQRELDLFALSRNIRKWRTVPVDRGAALWPEPPDDIDDVFQNWQAGSFHFDFPNDSIPLYPDPELFDEESYVAYYTGFLGLIPHDNYVAGNEDHPFVITLEQHIGRARCLVRTPQSDIRLVLQLPLASTNKKQALRAALPPALGQECALMTRYATFDLKQRLLSFDKDFSLRPSLKFGVLYCAPDQRTEKEMMNNQHEDESSYFKRFVKFLGHSVNLENHEGFRGGLDPRDSPIACYTKWRNFEIVYHISSRLIHKAGASQQLLKKRHIGNDTTNIIFQDVGPQGPVAIDLSSFSSKFTYNYVVVRPELAVPDDTSDSDAELSDSEEPADNDRGSEKKTKRIHYRIAIACKDGVLYSKPEIPGALLDPFDERSRDFFLAKLVGVERAAQYAPAFEQRIIKARRMCLQGILKDFPPTRPGGLKGLTSRSARRSTSSAEKKVTRKPPKKKKIEDDPEDATRKIDLRNFELIGPRLSSYISWPHEVPSAEVMAASGLFLLPCKGASEDLWDKVKCPFGCGIVMGGWEKSDDPLAEHKRMSPGCPFFAPKKRGSSRFSLRNSKKNKAAARRAAEAAIAGATVDTAAVENPPSPRDSQDDDWTGSASQ